MPAYSQDLRQRVIDAVQRKEGSIRQIARRFVVSLSFVVRLLQAHRRTGSIRAAGRPAADRIRPTSDTVSPRRAAEGDRLGFGEHPVAVELVYMRRGRSPGGRG